MKKNNKFLRETTKKHLEHYEVKIYHNLWRRTIIFVKVWFHKNVAKQWPCKLHYFFTCVASLIHGFMSMLFLWSFTRSHCGPKRSFKWEGKVLGGFEQECKETTLCCQRFQHEQQSYWNQMLFCNMSPMEVVNNNSW
jgi:hypothetical protein